MKAIVQDVYGSADTLRVEDNEMPVIGDAGSWCGYMRPVSTPGYGIA
ncbi:MAG: hypothetical protein WB592_19360 [Acidimicrobiales bacterium]|jgi:hypothetical protein